MATHSGILAWRFPWTEEPNRLQSMGFQKVGQIQLYIYIHTHILFYVFFSIMVYNRILNILYILLYSLYSLCYTIGPCCLSILYLKSLHLLTLISHSILPQTPFLLAITSLLFWFCFIDRSLVSYFRLQI